MVKIVYLATRIPFNTLPLTNTSAKRVSNSTNDTQGPYEGVSKRSEDELQGRNSANKVIIFPKGELNKGQYVNIEVTECSSATLKGKVVEVLS